MTLDETLRQYADQLTRTLDVPSRDIVRDRARILSYLQAAADIGAKAESLLAGNSTPRRRGLKAQSLQKVTK